MAAKKQTTKAAAKSKATTKAKKGTVQKPKAKQKRSDVVRKIILEADNSIQDQFLVLAEALYEAYHREYFIEWKYDDFADFCDAEMKTHYRKSMYMIRIWEKIKEHSLPKAKLAKLGWTKAKELVEVVDAKNAEEWIKKAEDMTTRELRDTVKVIRRKAKGEDNRPVTTTMRFKMSEGEAHIITEALEEAKKLTDNQNDTLALEMICQDWLQDKGKVPERTSIDEYVAFIEQMFAVEVTYKVKAENGKKKKAKQIKEAEAEVEAKAAKAKKKRAAEANIEDIIDTPATKDEPVDPPADKGKDSKKKAEEEADITELLDL